MCRHTTAKSICGHPRQYYVKRLGTRKRFRLYICSKTENDIRVAIEAHGQLPAIDSLMQICGFAFGTDYVGTVLRDKLVNRAQLVERHMKKDAEVVSRIKKLEIQDVSTCEGPKTAQATPTNSFSPCAQPNVPSTPVRLRYVNIDGEGQVSPSVTHSATSTPTQRVCVGGLTPLDLPSMPKASAYHSPCPTPTKVRYVNVQALSSPGLAAASISLTPTCFQTSTRERTDKNCFVAGPKASKALADRSQSQLHG